MSTATTGVTPGFVSPMLATLSELDHRRMTVRDWLTLLPAVLVSLLLNGAFITLLVLFNSSDVRAESRLKSSSTEETTGVEDKNKEEATSIDINTPEFETPKEIPKPENLAMPAINPADERVLGMTEPPKERDPIGGAGAGDDGKLRGADSLGQEAIKGDPLFAELGGVGSSGSMPLGSGAGINTGVGGGSSRSGGFGYRSGDMSALARKLGGTEESERAVSLGLLWLKMHQSSDGRWSLDKYHTYDAKCNCRVEWEKDVQRDEKGKPIKDDNGITTPAIRSDDVSGTSLGVLPFLGAGHHHLKPTDEGKTVARALAFLLSRQRGDGSFGIAGESRQFDMYTQGMATIALCEAYGMSGDQKLREAAQRAVFFICKAQESLRGGWRYQPNTPGDTSVVGWQVMALKSAQMAGLTVPGPTLEGASKWLDYAEVKMMRNGRPRIRYSYEVKNDLAAPGRFVPSNLGTGSTTAAGLLNRLYLGWGPRNSNMIAGCDELMDTLPPIDLNAGKDVYYWYYASQVMHHMGGEYWNTWNPRMRDYLIKTQERQGHKAGSWDPTGDNWAKVGGRLYETSLSLLTLEVYYRHLPLYRREKLDKESNQEIAQKQAAQEKKEEMKTEPKKK